MSAEMLRCASLKNKATDRFEDRDDSLDRGLFARTGEKPVKQQ
jgi:hypothetical protein